MATDDTGWRKAQLVTDSEGPKGLISMPTEMQQKPCFMCRSFENDNTKLVQHLLAKGLERNAEGKYITPIVQDFDGRKSLEIDPLDYGWCRGDGIVTAMAATCASWAMTEKREDMIAKLKGLK